MDAIRMTVDVMLGEVRRLQAATELLPPSAALTPVLGPRPSQYAAVAPVVAVLDNAPAVFSSLREELLGILEDCATAFSEAAAILEGAESAALTEVNAVTATLDDALELGGDTPATPTTTAPQPAASGADGQRRSGF